MTCMPLLGREKGGKYAQEHLYLQLSGTFLTIFRDSPVSSKHIKYFMFQGVRDKQDPYPSLNIETESMNHAVSVMSPRL